LFSTIFPLSDDIPLDILAEYGIEYQKPPNALICFQPVSNIFELSNNHKFLLGSRSFVECSVLSLELKIVEGCQSNVLDSFGVPLNQSVRSRYIDLVRVASDSLNWGSFQKKDSCCQIIHPFYGQNIFLGGMVVTEAEPSMIARALAYKLALDWTLAIV
jgi:hypothetical protein